MGAGSYWTRKDDQSEELRTLKPWDEAISNGDKFIPEPEEDKDQKESVEEDKDQNK